LLVELEDAIHSPIKVDRQNPRRVIRAWKYRLTDKPFSAQRAEWSESIGSSAKLFSVEPIERGPARPHRRAGR